ncbi:MAG: biopolymer transporter ExbD [Myxococcaceae bacterium]|nr:biopolymer transporter ExbD [Myxococcaceae bacterium]MCI0673493.1 biopolymer transporter ExbD [Myxococcaceae bacterium]
MGLSAGSGRSGVKSEINVTPLVDVVLVLLIIFMVVTPMMQRGRDVKLPSASNASEGSRGDPLVLSVSADRGTYVESERFMDDAELRTRLAHELRARPERKLLLKADRELSCGDIRRVVELAQASGARGMAFGVDPLQTR